MRLAPASQVSAKRRICAAIENLESRQLMTAYLVDSEVALAAINNTNLNAGDVVMLKGGTMFTTKLTLDGTDSGTGSSPVVITSYDPATRQRLSDSAPASARATIKASSGDAIFVWNASGVSIENLNLTGGSSAVSGSGVGIAYWTGVAASDFSVRNVDVSNFREYGIQIGSTDATLSNVRLTNINAYGNANGIGTYSNGGKFVKNLYLGHSVTHHNPGVAGATNPTGGGIELGGVDGAVVEYNESYANGASITGPGGFGIWAYSSNNVTMQYNESHHNTTQEQDGGGFDLDGGVTNSVMQYNYSHDNVGAGYALFQYSGASSWGNNVVRNNVSVNDGTKFNHAAIEVWSADGTFGSATVENNQVIKANARYTYFSASSLVSKVTLLNNKFVTSGTPNLAGIGLSGPVNLSTATTTTTPTAVTTDTTDTTTPVTPIITTEPTTTSTGTTSGTTTTTTTTTTRKTHKKHRR